MFVVGHQDKGMEMPPIGLNRAAKPFKALRTVSIVAHDRPLLIAARDDMVQRSRILNASGPNHDG